MGQFPSPDSYRISQSPTRTSLRVGSRKRGRTKGLWLELCEGRKRTRWDKLQAMVRDITAALDLKIGRLKQASPHFACDAGLRMPVLSVQHDTFTD